MKTSIKTKAKLFILFTICSIILLSEMHFSFSLSKGRRTNNKSMTPIETDYSEGLLVFYCINNKIHYLTTLIKNALTIESDGSKAQYLIAKDFDVKKSATLYSLLLDYQNLKTLSDYQSKELGLENLIYVEFKFNEANSKIIPFLTNMFAFNLQNSFTFVISNIAKRNTKKIEILIDGNKYKQLKEEVEKEIRNYSDINQSIFW